MSGAMRPWSAIDDYQHAASDYLYNNDEALALLPTGAGKTLIAMTPGQELMNEGVVKRPLVLAPLRVAQITWPGERHEWEHLKDVEMVEWGGEPKNWAPSLWKDSRILFGKRVNRERRIPKENDVVKRRKLEAELEEFKRQEKVVNKAIRATQPPACWHVTSFENVPWITELYKPGQSPFDLWVIDETGKVARNPKSPRYKALAKHVHKAKIRWGLNATPAPEGMEDLFGQVQVIAGPRIWGKSFYQWRQKFFTPADYHGYTWRLQLGAFEPIMADLNKISFKVPDEVLTYQKTIRHSQIKVDLPPKARAAYNDMAKQMAVEIEGVEDIVAMSEAVASMKLRQITQGFIYEEDERGRREVHILHEEKVHALADLIDGMGREPLLIGYEFEQDLANIRKIWKNVPYLGNGVSAADAKDHVDKWNKRELPILALHPNSASHGINLQYGGHHIAWLALPWGLDPYKQTNERIDRRGQEHACFGHHIIANKSKDQQVSDALIRKDVDQNKVIAAIKNL